MGERKNITILGFSMIFNAESQLECSSNDVCDTKGILMTKESSETQLGGFSLINFDGLFETE